MDASDRGTVLFVTYYFPPAKAIACARTWALAKYLGRLGWRIKVVTPGEEVWADRDPEPLLEECARDVNCLRTRYWRPWLSPDTAHSRRTLRGKVGRWIGWTLYRRCGLEPMLGWSQAARRALRDLTPGAIHVVMASGPPFSAFELAGAVAQQQHCPLVLDYRDLWTANPFDPLLNTARNRKMEKVLLGRSALVTANSPQMAQVLGQTCSPDKIHVLTNGYDPDRLQRVKARMFRDKAVVYTGILYSPARTLDPVFRAMWTVSSGGKELPFRVHYFGPHAKLVEAAAARFGVSSWVINHGSVSRETALAAVAGAHVAVVVNSVRETAHTAERGVVPGKLFEALGLGKKLLVIAPEGSDVGQIVGSNGQCFKASQTAEIASFLLDATRPATSPYLPPPERYSWEHLAADYSELLGGVLAREPAASLV